ncbi:MAG: hypothetical protein F6K11_25790 [Leptolyngbya sp. SIO3F4]|nr:hypothetical protein [Leptolyngbya sp. SIO3F4]
MNLWVNIDHTGIARVFSNGTACGQDAYFLAPKGTVPEQLEPGWPLVWDNHGEAVRVYKIAGPPEGAGEFNLNDWSTASGGH